MHRPRKKALQKAQQVQEVQSEPAGPSIAAEVIAEAVKQAVEPTKGARGTALERARATVIRRSCQRKGEKMVLVLEAIALDGDARDSDRIAAATSILDRGYGKPKAADDGDKNKGGSQIVILTLPPNHREITEKVLAPHTINLTVDEKGAFGSYEDEEDEAAEA